MRSDGAINLSQMKYIGRGRHLRRAGAVTHPPKEKEKKKKRKKKKKEKKERKKEGNY